MEDVPLIGVDLAQRVFHLHGAAGDGSVVFRKKLSRAQFDQFMKCHPHCVVAMEACGSAHYWGRSVAGFGHEVRLGPPVYAKQYVSDIRTMQRTPRRLLKRHHVRRCGLLP